MRMRCIAIGGTGMAMVAGVIVDARKDHQFL